MAKRERTLEQVFFAAYKAAGKPSWDSIARKLERDWGVTTTDTTVTSYHRNAPKKLRLDIVQGLMGYYALTLAELPQDVRRQLERLRDQLVAASAAHPSATGKQQEELLRGRGSNSQPMDGNSDPATIGRSRAA